MTEWQTYESYFQQQSKNGSQPHSVAGNVKVLPSLYSPQLKNKRHILVYLPPSYEEGGAGRYPVLYMHDGQNLFDEATSFAEDWHVDETMEALSTEGLEAIVVGIPNMGESRIDEYSPFPDPRLGGGKGDRYLAFIADTLKPRIDRDFRTLPEQPSTGIIGSSMGGLISLYAFFQRDDIFGLAGVMSPSLWFARGAIFDYVEAAPHVPGRIYLDAGTRELSTSFMDKRQRLHSRRYYVAVRRMHRLLYKKGYRPRRQLLYVEEKWAGHREAAWARRLPDALRFLLQLHYA